MRKIIFILILILGKTTSLFSQNLDSLVSIKGYYITQFSKSEIEFSYNQKINMVRGESYSTPLDYKQASFFVPIQINNTPVLDVKNILEHFSTDKISRDSIFYIPTDKMVEQYVKSMIGVKIDVSREICIISEITRSSQYYTINGHDTFLYKCAYIEGSARQKTIKNEERERFKVNLDIYSVNRKSSYLDLFFITEIKNYSLVIDITGLQRWLPYINQDM